ncbi:hypothetical protein M758_11G077600 [Ceratodon purpureus]|uniref:Uncharacterized protein n=1 Tax=Ceratodon purpureus TaxID=3225 RepID=A0A8T0GI27_CERPU|nr:hypothetical protein KC19_11G080200 [Ceratodon purpureus]KAG0601016.1 hypothetical protein M758_11G077600 [Ceratodon purpureus]
MQGIPYSRFPIPNVIASLYTTLSLYRAAAAYCRLLLAQGSGDSALHSPLIPASYSSNTTPIHTQYSRPPHPKVCSQWKHIITFATSSNFQLHRYALQSTNLQSQPPDDFRE